MAWVRARLCKLQKGCTRLAAASDKVYQLLAHGRLFSSGTPASSTTKTGRHDIAKILLKVALNTKNKNKINKKRMSTCWYLQIFSDLFHRASLTPPLLIALSVQRKESGRGMYIFEYIFLPLSVIEEFSLQSGICLFLISLHFFILFCLFCTFV